MPVSPPTVVGAQPAAPFDAAETMTRQSFTDAAETMTRQSFTDAAETMTRQQLTAPPPVSPVWPRPPQAPPTPPPPPPPSSVLGQGFGSPGYGPTSYPPAAAGSRPRGRALLIVGALVVLAIAGTVVGIVVATNSGHSRRLDTSAGHSDVTEPTNPDDGGFAGDDGESADGSAEDQAASPTPAEAPRTALGLVDITAVDDNSRARKIARTFNWYFSNINNGDYERAADALADHEPPHDPTTQDSKVVIRRIFYRGGRLLATVTFRSHQAPRYAPDGYSRCVDWRLTWPIVPRRAHGLAVLLDKPVHVRTPYRQCGY